MAQNHRGKDPDDLQAGWDAVRRLPPKPPKPTIIIPGDLPVKKNLWATMRGGRVYLPASIRRQLDAMILAIRTQWRRPPLRHPMIAARFVTTTRRRDLDGLTTTLLDLLVAAEVLEDDNIARCNGPQVILPAAVSKTSPRTLVWLWGQA